jgi:tetratricopeptide (TPR) repeat protein
VHAILIWVALALAASSARAPSADEQRLYDEGLRAFQAGDARAAEKAWKAGYAVARDPAFLVHIGEAQEKAGAPGEAADSYRRYLREAPDAADRPDIEQRLARLAPGAPQQAAPAAPAPAETPGEFGATPPAPTLAPPSPPAGRAPISAGDAEQPSRPRPADSGWNRYNITAVASASAAVVLLGVAALFAAEASSAQDDIDRLLRFRDPDTQAPLRYSAIADQYEQAMAAGPRNERNAKIAFVGSAVAAAVSATFFILDAKLGGQPAVAITPAGRGIVATGGWQWAF